MKKYFISIFLFGWLVATSCSKATLFEEESVIQPTVRVETELDKWIDTQFTKVYNTEVKYRWDAKSLQSPSDMYPPKEANVKPVLETITRLLFDVYSLKTIVGESFAKKHSPKQILLFGGKATAPSTKDGKGEEISQNLKPLQMQLYAIDEYDARDMERVRKLMRMAHNNYAKMLTDLYPYNAEEYKKLNFSRIKFDPGEDKPWRSMKQGFFSIEASRKRDDDFAETVSVLLSYPRKEIEEFIEQATTPIPILPTDPQDLIEQRIQEKITADKARKTLEAKRSFVAKYYKETLGIDFYKLQAESALRMHRFVNNQIK